jgi:hypothetical protein
LLFLHKFHPAYDDDENLHVPDIRELPRALRAVESEPGAGS